MNVTTVKITGVKSVTQFAWIIILGLLPLHFMPVLIPPRIAICLVSLSLFLCFLPWSLARRLALWLLVVTWSMMEAWHLQSQINTFSQQRVTVVVRVIQWLPDSDKIRIRLMQHQGQPVFPPLQADIYGVAIRHALDFCAGQRWQMTVQLKPVHARLNEGGFDRQRFMLASMTPLTGKVFALQALDLSCGWRARLIAYTQQQYGHLPWQAIISALAFGERQAISDETNQLLRETGIAHLMAISGLHIALAASCGWLLARGIQFFFPARWIGFRFPLMANLCVAALYVWLSGNDPPAVRTLVVLLLWSVVRLLAINCHSWQIWSWCVALILLLEPFSLFSDSFWLSAIASASLIIWYHFFPLPERLAKRRRWLLLQLLHVQVGIILLLLPVQTFLFHGISLSSLLANLWAIPVVSFVSVPLLLAGIVFSPLPTISLLCWKMADWSLACVFIPLQQLPAGWLTIDREGEVLCLISWLLLLYWRLGCWRHSPVTALGGIVVLMSLCSLTKKTEWRLDMLDVGHGLAIVISQHGKAVLYDTGNRWQKGDAGSHIILPWLRWQGLEPEMAILSHAHLDHTGGLQSVQDHYPAMVVRSALGQKHHLPCQQGEQWRWQQLTFRVLWPENVGGDGGNNHSCVVMVSDGRYRVLLTGDLESQAEQAMVARFRSALQADIIQVPHHGSRTSSSSLLLRTVKGTAAIASVARYNAWRLPAQQIITRYRENGFLWYDTALFGQLSVQFYPDRWQILSMRKHLLPRWYHQWFGVQRDSR